MANSFSRNLALLRQEKNLSQRKVAGDLGVSQALLSHYENGVREPGLNFVLKACDYYGVSADFLLGATMSRDGTTISAEELHDAAADKDNRMGGASVLAILRKKLLVNSIGVIFDILGKTGDSELTNQAYNYLSGPVYKIFRYVYDGMGTASDSFFSSPPNAIPYGADADMALSEMNFLKELQELVLKNERELKKEGGQPVEPLSHGTLSKDYPLLIQSLLTLIQNSDERVKRNL